MDDIIYQSDDELPDPCVPETQDPEIMSISSSDGEEACDPLPEKNVQVSGKSEPIVQDVVQETDSCSSDTDDMLFIPLKSQGTKTQPIHNFEQNCEKAQVKTNIFSKNQTKKPGDRSSGSTTLNYVQSQPSGPSCSNKILQPGAGTGSLLATKNSNRSSVEIPQHCDSSSDEEGNDSFSFLSQVSTMFKKTTLKENTLSSKCIVTEKGEPSTPIGNGSSNHGEVIEMQDKTSPVFSRKPLNSSSQVKLSSQTPSSSPLFSLPIANSYSNSQCENIKTVIALLDKCLETNSQKQNDTGEKMEAVSGKDLQSAFSVTLCERSQGDNTAVVKVEEADGNDDCEAQNNANATYQVTDEGSLYVFDSDDEEMFLSQMIQHGSLESEYLSNRDSEERNTWEEDDDWLAGVDYNGPEYCVDNDDDDAESHTNLCNLSTQEENDLREEGGFLADDNQSDIVENAGDVDVEKAQKERECLKLNKSQANSTLNGKERYKQTALTMSLDSDNKICILDGEGKPESKNQKRDGRYSQSRISEKDDMYNVSTQVAVPDADEGFCAQTLVNEQRQDISCKQKHYKKDGKEPTYEYDSEDDYDPYGISTQEIVYDPDDDDYDPYGISTQEIVYDPDDDDYDPYGISTQEIVYDPDDNDPFCVQTMISRSPQDIDTTCKSKHKENDTDSHDSFDDDDNEDPYNVPTQTANLGSDEGGLFFTSTLACDEDQDRNFGPYREFKTKNRDWSFGFRTDISTPDHQENLFENINNNSTQSETASTSDGQIWTSGKTKKLQKKECSTFSLSSSNDVYNVPTQIVVSDSDERNTHEQILNSCKELSQDSDIRKVIQKQRTKQENNCDTANDMSYDDDPYNICTQPIEYDPDDSDPFCVQTMVSGSLQDIYSAGKLNKCKTREGNAAASSDSSDDEDLYNAPTQVVNYDSDHNDPFYTSTLASEGKRDKQSGFKPSPMGQDKKDVKQYVMKSKVKKCSPPGSSSDQNLLIKASQMMTSSSSSDDDEPIFALKRKNQAQGSAGFSFSRKTTSDNLWTGSCVRALNIEGSSHPKNNSNLSDCDDPYSLPTQKIDSSCKPSLEKKRNKVEKSGFSNDDDIDKIDNLKTLKTGEFRVRHDNIQMMVREDNDERDPFLENTQVVGKESESDGDRYCQDTQIIEESKCKVSHDVNNKMVKDDKEITMHKVMPTSNGQMPFQSSKQNKVEIIDAKYDGDANSIGESISNVGDQSGQVWDSHKRVRDNIKISHENSTIESEEDSDNKHMQSICMVSNKESDKYLDAKLSNSEHLDEAYFLPTQAVSEDHNSQAVDIHLSNSQQQNEELSSDDDIYMLPTQTDVSHYRSRVDALDQLPKHAKKTDCTVHIQVTNEKGDNAYNAPTQIVNIEPGVENEAFGKGYEGSEDDIDDVYLQQTQTVDYESRTPEHSMKQFSKPVDNLKDKGRSVHDIERDKSVDDIYNQETQIFCSAPSVSDSENEQIGAKQDESNQNHASSDIYDFTNTDSVSENLTVKLTDKGSTHKPDCDTQNEPKTYIEKLPKVKTNYGIDRKKCVTKKDNIPGASLGSAQGKKATSSTGNSFNSSVKTPSLDADIRNTSCELEAEESIKETEKDRSFDNRLVSNKNSCGPNNESSKLSTNSREDNHSKDCSTVKGQFIHREHTRNVFDIFHLRPLALSADMSNKFPLPEAGAKDSSFKKRAIPTEIPDSNRKKKQKISNKKETKLVQSKNTLDTNKQTTSSGSHKAKNNIKRSRSLSEHTSVHPHKRKRRSDSSASSAKLNSGIEAAKSVMEKRRLSAQRNSVDDSSRGHTNNNTNVNKDGSFFEDAVMPSTQEIIALGLPIMNAVLPVNKRLLAQGLPSRELANLDQSSSSENSDVTKATSLNKDNFAQSSGHHLDHETKYSSLNEDKSVKSISQMSCTSSNSSSGDLRDSNKSLNSIHKNPGGPCSDRHDKSSKSFHSSNIQAHVRNEPVNHYMREKNKTLKVSVNKPDLVAGSSSNDKNQSAESLAGSKNQFVKASSNQTPVDPQNKSKNMSSILQGSKSYDGTKQEAAAVLEKPSHTTSGTSKRSLTIETSVVNPTVNSLQRSILKNPVRNDTVGTESGSVKTAGNIRICDRVGKKINFDESKNRVWTFNSSAYNPNQSRAPTQMHNRAHSSIHTSKGHMGNFKTDMISSLLRWNSDWLQEQVASKSKDPPPILGDDKKDWQQLEGLRLYYSTPQEYTKITCNLLKLELWEGIFKEWSSEEKNRLAHKENKVIHLRHMISENMSMSNESEIQVFHMEGFCSEQGFFLYPGDILLLTGKNEKAKTREGNVRKTQFAYVRQFQRIEHQRFGSNIRKAIAPDQVADFKATLQTKNRLVSFSKGSLNAVKLCSVVPDERLMDVLNSVQHNQFLKQLLADPNLHRHIYHHQFSTDKPHPELNREQARAVFTIKEAVLSPAGRVAEKVFLLQGPPGTGKSQTIMALIYEILLGCGHKKRICLATPSNAAVDQLAQRIINFSQKLQRTGKPAIKMVRIGKECMDHNIRPYSFRNLTKERVSLVSERRAHDSVKTEIRMHREKMKELECTWKKSGPAEQASIRSDLTRLEKKLRNLQVKPSEQDFSQAERQVLQESHVICGTLSSFGQLRLHTIISSLDRGQPFGCIIIDEATQAKEVECLIPLQFNCQKLVLVGDQEQLQPTVVSHRAQEKELGRSLFTRLHMCLTQRETREGVMHTNPVLSLRRQYRMADAILQFPNEAFYQGKLFTDEVVQKKRNSNPYKLAQYLVFDISDSSEMKGDTAESMSKCNPIEAECAGILCDMVNHLIRKAADRQNRVACQERIGVISPYRMQKKEIERQLQKRDLRRIAVETVDAFQGQEKDVIIMSCVRAQSDASSVGFLAERERMNVSLTRAKLALYILGNFNTMQSDPLWKALYENAKNRGLLVSIPRARDFSTIAEGKVRTS